MDDVDVQELIIQRRGERKTVEYFSSLMNNLKQEHAGQYEDELRDGK